MMIFIAVAGKNRVFLLKHTYAIIINVYFFNVLQPRCLLQKHDRNKGYHHVAQLSPLPIVGDPWAKLGSFARGHEGLPEAKSTS